MDPSPAQDVPNISVSRSSMLLMPDLGSRIKQALELAPSSDEQSGVPHIYVNTKTLRAFHHFITMIWEVPTFAKDIEVARNDMVQLAFRVCMKSSWHLFLSIVGP